MVALHLLLVLVLVGTGLMGWWQLESWRAEQAADAAARLGRAPVPLGAVLGPDEALAGEDVTRPVVVEGRYGQSTEQFLVSGREQDGTDGYWVLSPLEVATTGSSLLVVRGWTPDASALPPVPAGVVRETGVLRPGEEGSGAVSPARVVAAVRIPALVGATSTDLYGAYLLRTDAQPAEPAAADLRAVTPPAAESSWSAGLRNLTYALQWWLFGLFGAFMWWRICSDRLVSARVGEASVTSIR